MKYKHLNPGFELGSPCLFPSNITITPREPLEDNLKESIAICNVRKNNLLYKEKYLLQANNCNVIFLYRKIFPQYFHDFKREECKED